MSAAAVVEEAIAAGIRLGLDGGDLALKAKARPPDALLAKLKAHKPEIVALLRATGATNPNVARLTRVTPTELSKGQFNFR